MSNVCRQCRREGKKLFLKGERCTSPKCAFTRRPFPPGHKSTSRAPKMSDFGKQLREKQKAKHIYGLRETQISNYYNKAAKTRESTGEKLLQLLEMRLDNVVYRLGFAPSIASSRQMVSHGKLRINGKKINIPSYQLKIKDKIELAQKEGAKLIKSELPVWLSLDKKDIIGQVAKVPSRQEIQADIDEGLIVEFYSR